MPIQAQSPSPAPKNLVQPYMGIVSWAGCPVAVDDSAGLGSQRLDRQAVHPPDELARHRLELFHQGPALVESPARRMVFEVRCYVARRRGER